MAGACSALPAEPLEEPPPTPGHGEGSRTTRQPERCPCAVRAPSPRQARAWAAGTVPSCLAKDLPQDTRGNARPWGSHGHHAQPWLQLPVPSHPTPPQQMPSPWGPWPWHPQNALDPARSLRLSRALGRMDGQTNGAPGTCPHPVPQWARWEGRPGVPEALGTRASRGTEGPGTAAWEGTIPVLPQDDAPGPRPTRRANTAAQHRGAAAPPAPDGPHAATAVAAAAGQGLTPVVTAPTRACAHQPAPAGRTRSHRR